MLSYYSGYKGIQNNQYVPRVKIYQNNIFNGLCELGQRKLRLISLFITCEDWQNNLIQ